MWKGGKAMESEKAGKMREERERDWEREWEWQWCWRCQLVCGGFVSARQNQPTESVQSSLVTIFRGKRPPTSNIPPSTSNFRSQKSDAPANVSRTKTASAH
uniref:HDC12031 n=1 Tax=Drosophila melanogaster TaxID=7227 RepID=Q6IKN3_DROME|nr:TPA_inf: HDC12031 [Drosophila melanogaster]